MSDIRGAWKRVAILEVACVTLIALIYALVRFSPKVYDWMAWGLFRGVPFLLLIAISMPLVVLAYWALDVLVLKPTRRGAQALANRAGKK